jgi:hypothetical protein
VGAGTIFEVTFADGTEEVSKEGRGEGTEGSSGNRGEYHDTIRKETSVEGGDCYDHQQRKGDKKIAAAVQE